MDAAGSRSRGLRVITLSIALSALSAFLAPLVFVGIIVMRRVERTFKVHLRHWTRRLQHEIARWS
jgi:hypothetical protein